MSKITHEITGSHTSGNDIFMSVNVYRDGRYAGNETIQYYFDSQFEHALSVRLSKYTTACETSVCVVCGERDAAPDSERCAVCAQNDARKFEVYRALLDRALDELDPERGLALHECRQCGAFVDGTQPHKPDCTVLLFERILTENDFEIIKQWLESDGGE